MCIFSLILLLSSPRAGCGHVLFGVIVGYRFGLAIVFASMLLALHPAFTRKFFTASARVFRQFHVYIVSAYIVGVSAYLNSQFQLFSRPANRRNSGRRVSKSLLPKSKKILLMVMAAPLLSSFRVVTWNVLFTAIGSFTSRRSTCLVSGYNGAVVHIDAV